MLFSLLLQEGPANTTSYMIAGYSVIFGVMLIYLISLMVRQRNLEKDLEVLEEIQGEEQ
jgi:hypothetical protein